MNTIKGGLCPKQDRAGFSHVEIMLVVVLLALAAVPVMNAFAPAMSASGAEEETTVFANQARGTLYRVVAEDSETLYDAAFGAEADAEGSPGPAQPGNGEEVPLDLSVLFDSEDQAAKENFIFRNRTYTPLVFVSDAGAGLGSLLKITVRVEQVTLTTLKAQR